MQKRPEAKTKLAEKLPVPLVPQPHGGALLAGGVPGHPGAGGRPPDGFKALCRALASGERTVAEVQAILDDRDHPHFMAALKWASEHGYGRPRPGDSERPPMSGVIVLGTLEGMDEARQRAQAFREREQGGRALPSGRYVPPPGHEVVVIEDDLKMLGSGTAAPARPDDAANATALTLAQQIAERRRKQIAERRRRQLEANGKG